MESSPPSAYLLIKSLSSRHPLWPSVSCGSQDSTVQESSSHKCGQKVSYRTFNVVAVAFAQIFLSFHSSSTFTMHILLNRISQKAPVSDRIYVCSVLCLSEKTLLLEPPFLTFPLTCYLWECELNTLTIFHSSSDQLTSSEKAQGPIYHFKLLPLQYTTKTLFHSYH